MSILLIESCWYGQKMGNILSKLMINNLELYLNDVYVKECAFQIEDEEVEFIQTGIELLSQRIVDWLADYFFLDLALQGGGRSVVEVYFPLEIQTDLQKALYGKIPYQRSQIIKVGSFYEGTKNYFPDEFDFIFPLYCLKRPPSICPSFYFLDTFYQITEKHEGQLKYINLSSDGPTGKKAELYFGGEVKIHGPAYTFLFIYENHSGDKRNIHVDLVPAIKIINIKKKDLAEWCALEPFRKRILATGSVLHVGINFAFTETELHFMKNVLSKKHVKLYRILKYLMNGHGDGVDDELIYNGAKLAMSSYLIKVKIISHHYECKNPDTSHIGVCMLKVLDAICHSEETPTLLGTGRINMHIFMWRPIIFYMSDYLLWLQQTDQGYEYGVYRCKKSVASIYLGLHLEGVWKVWWDPVIFERPYTGLPVSYRP